MTRQLISILTPCFNEEENVNACAAEVARVMRGQLPDYDYEHIFCDNASTDSTVAILRGLAAEDPHIKVVVNSRNVGPLANTVNGLNYVSGDLVVPFVPADIQDPPDVIPAMVAKMTPLVDVVYGIRKSRSESVALRISRSVYYTLVKVLGAGQTPPSHAGEFLLARRHIVDAVKASGAQRTYLRGLVAQTRPRYDTVPYAWGVREHGKSRNNYFDLVDQGLTGLVTTARAPLRVALPLGFLFAAFGLVYATVTVVLFLTGSAHADAGVATLIIGVFLFGGLQLLLLGIVGEYVVAVHRAVNPPPPVLERERINL